MKRLRQQEREEIAGRRRGLWRWAELLPVRQEEFRTSLGEGDSPLIRAARLESALEAGNPARFASGMRLFIKDESCNPTGTFKARGLCVAVSRAGELGRHNFVLPTAGNAGGALAAYAARSGARAHIFMPRDAPAANQAEVRAAGAELVLVDGTISDAARSASTAGRGKRWLDISTFHEPYRLEGKKTIGFELAEAFHWKLPDVILAPTGGGTGLVGMWKAFAELEELGWIGSRRPRMVSVQAAGCAPLVRAMERGTESTEAWPSARTLAAGLRVPKSFADRLILRILRGSHGCAVEVSDEEMLQSQQDLARLEGLFCCPEGSATLAALKQLLMKHWIHAQETIVLLNTGTGLKYI
jgi:threonine synthase